MKIKRVTMGQSACSVHFADGTSLLGIPHDAAEAFEHERRLGYAECERKNAGQIQALKARLQTAEKAAHEWRERAEGKEDGTRCKSCGGGLDGPGWDCQWCGERAGA